jgi:hypothetical protein
MMDAVKPYRAITLQEFANTFVLFGMVLVAALLAAESTLNLTRYRAVYCLWAAVALAIPAICFYLLAGDSLKRRNYGLLFWSFALIAFAVHLGYAVLGLGQYHLISVVLAVWWVLDLFLGWWDVTATWVRLERACLHAFAVLWFAFLTLSYPGEELVPRILGAGLLLAVLVSLGDRVSWETQPPTSA